MRRREAWNAVVGRMEGLLRSYPASEDVPMALARLAYARHQLDQGERAAEVAQRLQTDYPGSRADQWLGRKAPQLISPQ